MKILVLDTLYQEALESFTETSGFDLPDRLGGSGGDYVRAFLELGHQAHRVIANSPRGLYVDGKIAGIPFVNKRPEAISRIPVVGNIILSNSDLAKNLLQAVQTFEPDLLYVLNPNVFSESVLTRVRELAPDIKIVGQISSPLPPTTFLRGYDRIFSMLEKNLRDLSKKQVEASRTQLAFIDRGISPKPFNQRGINIAFIGSIGRHHSNTIPLLREISRSVDGLQIYSPRPKSFFEAHGLGQNYVGTVFGLEMLKVLADTRIVVNRHAKFADDTSLNLRAYETAGMGAALLTEKTSASSEVFGDSGALLYESNIHAGQLARDILGQGADLMNIAIEGHRRVIKHHTLDRRLSEVLKEVE